MANNPNVNKVVYGNDTLIDISDTTAVASDVASGKVFYTKSGARATGTATGGTAAIGIEDALDAGGGIIRTVTAVDLSNDTVAANNLLQGYTAHDSTGAAITGTYTPPASVNVQTDKAYTVSAGGNQTISPDSGYDAMDEVALSVPTTTAATPTLSLVSGVANSYIEGVSNQTTGWVTQAQKRGTYSLTRIVGQTITPTTNDQTIIANDAVVHAYNGAVKVAGSSALTAGNIKSGTTIFGITGTYAGLDTSDATATAADIASGKTAYVNGSKIIGTASGGSSSWTLLASTTLTVQTTSTAPASAGTVNLGSGHFDKDKIIWVHIRDRSGKRNGYFYGSDTYFQNYQNASGVTSTLSVVAQMSYCYNNSAYAATSGPYGVYGYSLTNAGVLTIRRRYNSYYTLTIDSTYDVEVYELTPPADITMFE